MASYRFEVVLEVEVDPSELGVEIKHPLDVYAVPAMLEEKITELLERDLDPRLNAEVERVELLSKDDSDLWNEIIEELAEDDDEEEECDEWEDDCEDEDEWEDEEEW
ncbi:hypothetical protein PYJP_04040 [Pyrofollis japonicus]|uniref:hypothetical protein n=1 Tax=Pyrofollis japonicus TaxID=3060460 RepID=UPI00295B2191|nr:hypothetical protein [Pyrofollis japonicus]BEP17052.1 hypothetical protein PYJP_04040 [Pyrofollis japonicus]